MKVVGKIIKKIIRGRQLISMRTYVKEASFRNIDKKGLFKMKDGDVYDGEK